jgi:hypothetical protein
MKFETQRGVALHEESDSNNELQPQSFVAVAARRPVAANVRRRFPIWQPQRRLEVDLRAPFLNRRQNVRDDFIARLRAQIAFAVDADADGIGFHVAIPDHKHGVDFHLLGAGDLRLDVIAARIEFATDLLGA